MHVALVLIALLPCPDPAWPTIRMPRLAFRTRHMSRNSSTGSSRLAADDKAAVAVMVNYPLTVHASRGVSRTYRDAAALGASYARVFTPEVKAAVAAAAADNLFARDQGVMIGQGEIWMNEIRGSIKIITVNHMQ